MEQSAYFEQMRNNRKDEILQAAKEIFLTQGIQDFSMQQLAQQLDISTVTLYKYFKNMDDIIDALQEEVVEPTMARILTISSSEKEETDPVDALTDLLQNFFDAVLKDQDNVALMLLFEVHSRNQSQVTYEQLHTLPNTNDVSAHMAELIDEGKKNGIIRPELDTAQTVDTIEQINTAMLQHIGVLNKKRFKKQLPDIKRQISQLLEMYASYLRASV